MVNKLHTLKNCAELTLMIKRGFIERFYDIAVLIKSQPGKYANRLKFSSFGIIMNMIHDEYFAYTV